MNARQTGKTRMQIMTIMKEAGYTKEEIKAFFEKEGIDFVL